ncbi:MAG: hypothetical protein ACRCVJ_13805 [Clostridium sp.]|uniref:hypothetical protein n=1 Tax=Clostridium sp. TaxID=1506 RepID=UPI003F2BED24
MNSIEEEVSKDIKSVLIWSICSSLVVVLFLAIYYFIGKDIKGIVNIPKISSQGGNNFLKLNKAINYVTLTTYLGYVFNYLYIIGAVYGAILGATSNIRTEGVIKSEYKSFIIVKLLASLEKYIAYCLIIGMTTFMALIVVTDINSALEYVLLQELYLIIGLIIIGILFMSIGFIICIITKDNVVSISITIGIVIYTYILGAASKLSPKVIILKAFSPFENMKSIDIVNYGFNSFSLLGIIFIILCCIAISILIYIYKLKESN